MINYIYNQMLYYKNSGFYLEGVWLWRISGVNQNSKNHSPSTL